MNKSKFFSAVAVATVSSVACASLVDLDMDRPSGIKVGERLTLRPYVSLSYTFDSNVDSTKHSKKGSQWLVNPGLGVDYISENWKINGAAWYEYHAYNHYTSQLNSSSWGEMLSIDWRDSMPNEKGWSFKAYEKFHQIAQDDDMSNHSGRGVGRDRQEFTADAVLERRLNENIHMAAKAGFYYLDYENNVDKYASLYGWQRTSVGGEVGYAASKWTDFIVAADYQWYRQDNSKNRGEGWYENYSRRGRPVAKDSKGWTIMGGIGTRATERLEYRLLGGWSRFEFGDGTKDIDGWTYQVAGNWKISDTLNMMAMGSSYYQPSEREYGSALKVYTMSAGLAKSFVRAKMTGTLDLSYRKETHEYTEYSADDYDEDIWTGRVGLNYYVNRFVTVFGRVEYQFTDSDYRSYEYDRWRATIGLRLAY